MTPQSDDPKKLFQYWIREREHIREDKESGVPRPWTKDPILNTYRFCNVRREDDRVTLWIRRNWSRPKDRNLVLAMAIARLVNWPDTLEKLGYPEEWNPQHFINTINQRTLAGHKTWSSAYIVSTNGNAVAKPVYVAQTVLNPIAARCAGQGWPTPLAPMYHALRAVPGVGSFIAGQIIADLKNTIGSPWHDAADWFTFVVPGPGSRRGLARLIGKPAPYSLSDREFYKHFEVAEDLAMNVFQDLCAQDIQNCLCEFDKYMRVRLGEGKPRQHYVESENV